MRKVQWVMAGWMLSAAACSGGSDRGTPADPASSRAETAKAPADYSRVRDPHSYARPAEARVTHVALDLRVDFTGRQLAGSATLTVARTGAASAVVLDTADLAIEQVTDTNGQPLKFELGAVDRILGQALTIQLPARGNEVVVRYRTSPSAAALQWLTAAQTAGKVQPYLFSQGQAILTRTWIPTQDSPAIRQTYTARIVVPVALRAVMSAETLSPDGTPSGTERQFEFRMREPIPPYLIAIAVGDIRFKPLGPRSGVYAEPPVLDRAADEFADVEKMIDAAEKLGGPYRWGRYDVLVLPPSFPFGGMENPRVTFATPTVLAGDRSLTSLIAHELAHSWSGNLVTNATWNDFWLNEGVTTYFERRIVESLYGKDQAIMLEVLGRRELTDEIQRFGLASPDTRLKLDLAGRNPDDGVTTVPYEKGAALLHVLEDAVGRDRFDAFLRTYFDSHVFQSLTTEEFAEYVRANLFKGDVAIDTRVGFDQWLYQPGLPSNAVALQSAALTKVDDAVAAFVKGASPASLPTSGWTTQHWQHFLAGLSTTKLTPAQVASLDQAFRFTNTGNSEVLFAWLRIAIKYHYQPAMPALDRFLSSQGRRKFLRPLYEDLMATDWGQAEARRIYTRARPGYHAVATATLDQIVK